MPDLEIAAKDKQQIHRIWDRLADFPASRPEKALTFLLQHLAKLLHSERCWWLAAFRMQETAPDDPTLGWRAGPIVFYNEGPDDLQSYRQEARSLELGEAAQPVLRQLGQSGRFRVNTLRDLAEPDYFESGHFRKRFLERGFVDSLIIATPVNKHTETYFCFYRLVPETVFEPEQVALASYALRGLKWFHRQALLSFGMMIADSPLTPTERKVLSLLLTGRSEKQIAAEMQHKPATSHEYILKIYRKFNVHSRAALTALWLGQTPTD